MERLKELIANTVVSALEQDYVYKKNILDLPTANCHRDLKLDTIYWRLEEIFTSDDCFIHDFKRSYWKGKILVDSKSKSLVSITGTTNLNKVSRDKYSSSDHYMKIISNSLNTDVKPNKQLSFDPLYTDGVGIYNKEFNDIFSDIGIDLKGYTYYIVAYDYKSDKVIDIIWYLFDSDFNEVYTESLIKFIKPDIIELTNSESETEDIDKNLESPQPNEGIKLGLKKKKSVKNS